MNFAARFVLRHIRRVDPDDSATHKTRVHWATCPNADGFRKGKR